MSYSYHHTTCQLMKLFLAILLTSPLIAAPIKDSFSDGSLHEATRGAWTYSHKTASCRSDPELYKKFKKPRPHYPLVLRVHRRLDLSRIQTHRLPTRRFHL